MNNMPAQPEAGPSRQPTRSPTPDLPPEISERRYSLRNRADKQLHPYEYDKKLYKRQMRGNPDAIVKLRSPGPEARRTRATATSNCLRP